MMLPRLRRLVPSLLLAGLAACLSGPEVEPQWVESAVRAPTEQVLWNASLLALEKQDYPLGAVVDRSSGQLVSGWKTSLAAFRSQGWRTKAWIEFERGEAGQYQVQVRVQRETNEDIIRPLDPSYAEWESAADDERSARILMQTIRSYLNPELELDEEGAEPAEPEKAAARN
jgi:hypothetical protein